MNGEFHLGPWLVQPRLNAIVFNGHSVRLEPKVMQVLVCLARGGGDVVEKEHLIRAVWPDTFVSDDALTRCISELRKTFEDDAREARVIQTIPKIGYRLVAPVRDVARPNHETPTGAEPESEAGTPPATAPLAATSRRSSAVWLAGGCAAILILLAAAWWFHRHAASVSMETIDSIAVLPFENATADPGVDYLSDGIAMSVSNGLARSAHLKVISQASTSYYRGQRINPPVVGEQLGAQVLVTGRMLKKGEHLVVDIELVQARDNRHLWGEEYERSAGEVMALEEELARDIISHLPIRPSQAPAPPMNRHVSNNEAYQLYLQGRYLWNQRTPDAIAKSIDYFQKAIAKDPQDALAYAGLADAYNLLSEYNSVPPRESFPKAKAAAAKALALDNSLAEAHTSVAMVKCSYDWDDAGAEAEFQRALVLDPNYATAHHWYSLLLSTLGRKVEARSEAEKALDLNPLSPIINSNLAKLDTHEKRFDDAHKIAQKLLDLYPQSPLTYGTLGNLHLEEGNCPAAFADMDKLETIAPAAVDTYLMAGEMYARCGQKSKALVLAQKLEDLSKQRYVAPSSLAAIYCWLGDNDQTLAWLKKGLALRDDGILHAKSEAACASLRLDPRFDKFLKEIKPMD